MAGNKSILYGKRILITGASGFIGANLLYRLTKLGLRPHIILRKESDTWRINKVLGLPYLYYADLRDSQKTSSVISKIRPQIIFHCAAYGGYHWQKELDNIIAANLTGTANLLNACLNFKFDCFINTGSSSEYGIKNRPMKESDLIEPLDGYGVSKAAQTLFCQSIARKRNLPITTLRLFSPYGYFEGPKRLIACVILSCLKNRNPRLSSSLSVRDFVFIEDVINAYLKAVANPESGGRIFNIAGGRQYSVRQVVNNIIKITSAQVLPVWDDMANPRVEPKHWQADISLAENILAWQPKNDLISGLEKTTRWFRTNFCLYERE